MQSLESQTGINLHRVYFPTLGHCGVVPEVIRLDVEFIFGLPVKERPQDGVGGTMLIFGSQEVSSSMFKSSKLAE
jgi:hypothetical protein